MDLLSPCRSCLQCLPFFHVSPPSTPPPAAAAPPTPSPHSQEASKDADPLHVSENLPCSDAVDATQAAPGVFPPSAEKLEQKQAPEDSDCLEEGMAGESEGLSSALAESDVAGAPGLSGIVIAPPVSANYSEKSPPEDMAETTGAAMSEEALNVPFINDVTFVPSGFMPLQSPITPAPFGSGYPAAPHTNSHHETEHGHDHGLSHHGHEVSHHEHEHGHQHRHHHHVEDHGSHHHSHDWPAAPYCEPPAAPEQPLDESKDSDELCKEDSFSQHAHHHSHGSKDSDELCEEDSFSQHAHHHSHGSQMALHGDEDKDEEPHHGDEDKDEDPHHIETSSSTPALDAEAEIDGKNSASSPPNPVPALVESYHSEPIVMFEDLKDDDRKAEHGEVLGQHGASRRRRREHFKDQLKGIKQQIKQGGHHIKEEGNKHMQTIIENMNKHAQMIEDSGGFSIVPRANNN